MIDVFTLAPIALLAALALVLDPRPARGGLADIEQWRTLRWQPNRLSLACVRQTCAQIGFLVALHVHELLSI